MRPQTTQSHLDVHYISVWPSVDIETEATLNLQTGVVSDIQVSDIDINETCEGEYIEFKDERFKVILDENDEYRLELDTDLDEILHLMKF